MDQNISSVIKNIYNSGVGCQNRSRVHFKKLAFYQYLHEIYPACSLKSSLYFNTTQRGVYTFTLKADQVIEIKNGIELTNERFKYTKQIHLRFGFYDSDIKITDNLPVNLTVHVNNRTAQLPDLKPSTTVDTNCYRYGKPIDITPLCHLKPNFPNKIEITWKNIDLTKKYYIGIFLLRKLNVTNLMNQLKQNRIKKSESTRKMIIDQIESNRSNDFEIETNLKVSLKCPLMKTRIKVPGRSILCKHVQCFDIENYLLMNEKKGTWLCPVCDCKAEFENLIIDELNQDILTKCTDDNIEFNADGTWVPVSIRNNDVNLRIVDDTETVVIELNDNVIDLCDGNSNEVVCISDDDDDCQIIEEKSGFDLLKEKVDAQLKTISQLFIDQPIFLREHFKNMQIKDSKIVTVTVPTSQA